MPAKKERRVAFQDNGTEYRVVHHGWDRHPGDALWGEFGIYEGDGLDGDVAIFHVHDDDVDDYTDEELIAMARVAVARAADGTW